MSKKTSNSSKNSKKKTPQKSINAASFTAEECLEMLNDTSYIIIQENSARLSSIGPAASESNTLADSVEFWKWMNRNYEKCGHFASTESMKEYISGSAGQQNWAKKVVQGKGYEWDWMSAQRKSFKNVFKTFSAGDVANRPGSDVTAHDLLTGADKEFQLKAYTSKNIPNLKNTSKDMAVVTNTEKVDSVRKLNYEEVVPFGNNESIQQARDVRLNQMSSGKATPTYNIQNIGIASTKAGMLGFVINASVETIASYKRWKSGKISTHEYLKEIMKSGGNAGIVSSCSAAIMIPITSTLTVAGVSNVVTIPIAFTVSAAVDKIIAPAFARGDYLEILRECTYYQNMTEFCVSLADTMEGATVQYKEFIEKMVEQQKVFNEKCGNFITPQALEDFEYYASLPMEDVGIIISGMLAVLKDTEYKIDNIKGQNCAQRMLRTVTGKNKATKEDIHRNYESLQVYISKAVQILFERERIDQMVIQSLGSQIIDLCKICFSVVSRVEVLESKVDNLTNSLLWVTRPESGVTTVSVKQISDETALRTYENALQLFNKGKLVDAYSLFLEAAQNNVPRAYYYLGEYFIEGYGHIKENRSEALENLRKGMNLGDSLAAYKYGLLKYDTDDFQYEKWAKDHIHAILALIKKDDPVALHEFGCHLMEVNPGNIEVLKDALGYFRKSADNSYWPGAFMYYKFTEDWRGMGIELPEYGDLINTVEWYKVQSFLGIYQVINGFTDYQHTARHLCESLRLRDDIIEPAGFLAFLLNTGKVKDSLADGLSKGNIPMYYSAGLSCEKAMALYQLGVMYYNGLAENACGKDLTKAYECFRRCYAISKQGFIARMLGYMNLVGEGTTKNPANAFKYLSEGYQLKDANSTELLAYCYKNGIGVSKDIEQYKQLIVESKKMDIPDGLAITQTFWNEQLENT